MESCKTRPECVRDCSGAARGRVRTRGRRRGRRMLRPMAEGLEGRTLLSVGLDPTYGFGGVAIERPDQQRDDHILFRVASSNAIALQNGKVVAVGTMTSSPSRDQHGRTTSSLNVSRLNTNGYARHDLRLRRHDDDPVVLRRRDLHTRPLEDIAVQSSGTIDVLGRRSATAPATTRRARRFVVAQLTANGAPGHVVRHLGDRAVQLRHGNSLVGRHGASMALGPDGKIVVAGPPFPRPAPRPKCSGSPG